MSVPLSKVSTVKQELMVQLTQPVCLMKPQLGHLPTHLLAIMAKQNADFYLYWAYYEFCSQ